MSQYHLTGHEQLTPSIAAFMAVAALGAYPGEAFLREVLTDDRILLRMHEFKGAIDDEIAYLMSLPEYVWVRMSTLVDDGYSAEELKDQTLKCAFVSSAYIQKETFAPLEREPYSLSQGDISVNLHELMRRNEAALDPVTRQVQELLAVGHVSVERMARAFCLLREMPFSVHMVEQAHGAAACLMKYHETYAERLLRARALICQSKPLFTVDADHRYEVKLRKKLGELDADLAEGPRHMSGFACFFSEYSKSPTSRSPPAAQGPRAKMSRAAVLYNALLPRERQSFESRADDAARSRCEQLSAERDEVLAQLQLCQDRRKLDITTCGLVNQVRSCKFSEEKQRRVFDRFTSLHDEGVFGSQLEKRELVAPFAPSADEQIMIRDLAEPFAPVLPSLPWLVPHMCRNRDRFQGVALTKGSPDAEVAWLFLFAHQRPFEAEFLELRRRPRVLTLGSGPGSRRTAALGLKTYDFLPLRHISSDMLDIGDDDEVFVLTGSIGSGPGATP